MIEQQVAQVAAHDSSGIWMFLTAVATGLFGWFGKMAMDRRRKPVEEGHSISLRTLLEQGLAETIGVRKALEQEAAERAVFRATIEATMVTKDHLHAELDKVASQVQTSVGAVHDRVNEHVKDYHRNAA
jgi:hypothetical protein